MLQIDLSANLEAVRLLAIDDFTRDTVAMSKSLPCGQFPSNVVDASPVPFDVELKELRQKDDEALDYCTRVTRLYSVSNHSQTTTRESPDSIACWSQRQT